MILIFLLIVINVGFIQFVNAQEDSNLMGEPYSFEGIGEGSASGTVASVDVHESDWELYMMRLINRARADPAGEAARIGSNVAIDNRAPVPPLAYDELVGNAANNHNNWMHENFGYLPESVAQYIHPYIDSFCHYETLNCTQTGIAAINTPSYTGVRPSNRMSAEGLVTSSSGENIALNWFSNPLLINLARINGVHQSFWNSTGHRNNMLSTSYTTFGFYIESRGFIPPRGGLNAPVDNILFVTQNFAKPSANPRTYILGLLYEDKDGNGNWTPRNTSDPMREGLGEVNFEVFSDGTSTVVASGATLDNGAFSVRLGNGFYDLEFNDARLSGGELRVENIVLSGNNTDAGDFNIRQQCTTTEELNTEIGRYYTNQIGITMISNIVMEYLNGC